MKRAYIAHKPFEAQQRFHNSRAPLKLFRGGAGSGKTTAGAAEALIHVFQNPGLDGFIIAPTYSLIHRVTLREFRRVVSETERRSNIKLIRLERKGERYIEFMNGSRVYYGSADRPDTLEGSNLAWAWCDEARYFPLETWQIINARCREPRAQRRSIFLTTTPAMNWVYDEFVSRKTNNHADIHCSAVDNPYLPSDYVDRLKASYSQSFFEQYVEGHWRALEGVVYPQYDPNASRSSWRIDPTLPVHLGVDFGINNPAAIFAQASGDRLHIIGELTPRDMTLPAFVLQISKWLRDRGCRPGLVCCDPAGRARSSHSGRRDIDLLQDEGFEVWFAKDPVLRSIRYGVDVVRGRFLNHNGDRNLFLSAEFAEGSKDNARGLIAMLRSYVFKPGSEVPIKDDNVDHIADCLRYLCVGLYGETSAARIETLWQYKQRNEQRIRKWH